MDPTGIFIRNLVFPLMERFKDNHIRQYTTELTRSQYLEPAQLLGLQEEKLRKLLLHCLDKVEFYKSYVHLKKTVFTDPFSALRALPVLDKRTFRQHSKSFISDGTDTRSLIPNKTGGSTGEPLAFYMDRKTVEYYEAARWRGLSWWGVRPGDKCAMFWGAPVDLSRYGSIFYRFRERLLKNHVLFPSFTTGQEIIKEHIKRLNKHKPVYLYGYTSAMHRLARFMLEEKISLGFAPRAVVSTSETLFDEQRHDMQNAFGCSVVNEYGARDAGILAYQCPNGSMHITMENAVLEVVDLISGNPAEPGRTGAVVVTDLNNFSMPRLRYSLGDAASLSPEKCGCRLGLPVLKDIQGRVDELLLSRDGNLVSSHLINSIMRNANGISRYRLTQHNLDTATLEIVKNPAFSPEEARQVKDRLSEVLGGVTISTKITEEILPGKSGKYRYIVREFPLN